VGGDGACGELGRRCCKIGSRHVGPD
jgi:hypothetical protein